MAPKSVQATPALPTTLVSRPLRHQPLSQSRRERRCQLFKCQACAPMGMRGLAPPLERWFRRIASAGWGTRPPAPAPSTHPFADASKGDDLLPAGTEDYIHIRIQQRNGRKTLTTVQGIADDYDKKKLVKAFKKKFACNGTVIEHPEYGEVIQLQGDQRKNICQFLVEIGLAKDDQLKVHGF
ncbi:hypothetical protein P7K49_010561 [Saguinus oedipus]|uniref:SUI1 domain-containing protein n=1 Tax=Saguinus oedipus TaxID=9490 RepID=A0ABQ9VNR5_SAGOE|nr:hypothetical protein P7K49_010561 [Saguinus oedipus]